MPKTHPRLKRLALPFRSQLSLEEIDSLIQNLDDVMDMKAASTGTATALHAAFYEEIVERLIHLKFPAKVWQQFAEYCNQNELDPVQQVKEAVVSYCMDLLRRYRMKVMCDSDDQIGTPHRNDGF